jgi:hypothetical protein
MKSNRIGLVGGLVAALLASTSPLAYAGPAQAMASPAAAATPWEAAEAGIVDALLGRIRGGLVHLATVLTNAGVAIITNRVIQAGTAPKNIGWGTGTTTAAVSQTALVTEAAPTTAGGRTVGTESRTTTTVTNDTNTWTGTVTAGGTLAITEAGLFDATSAGNMLIRGDFAAVNVVSGDSIAFTFGLKFVPG